MHNFIVLLCCAFLLTTFHFNWVLGASLIGKFESIRCTVINGGSDLILRCSKEDNSKCFHKRIYHSQWFFGFQPRRSNEINPKLRVLTAVAEKWMFGGCNLYDHLVLGESSFQITSMIQISLRNDVMGFNAHFLLLYFV